MRLHPFSSWLPLAGRSAAVFGTLTLALLPVLADERWPGGAEAAQTRFGLVEVEFRDTDSRVLIDGQPTRIAHPALTLDQLWQLGAKDVLLLGHDNADGHCDRRFQLLVLDAQGARMSAPFGNCNEKLQSRRQGTQNTQLRFHFARHKAAPATTVVFDGVQLIEAQHAQTLQNALPAKP